MVPYLSGFHRNTVLACLAVSLLWSSVSHAQDVGCPPDPEGIVDDVHVTEGWCTLTGVTVLGSVFVSGDASVTVNGGTEVFGDISADSGRDVIVENATIFGNILLVNSGNLSLGAGTSAGIVRVDRSGHVSLSSGSVTSIESIESTGITISDARVFPGGVSLLSSTGSLVICGSEIGLNSDLGGDENDDLGSGGINVLQTTGDLLVAQSDSCAPSRIRGSVSVAEGSGNVLLVGVAGDSNDVSVSHQHGSVELEEMGVSDVLINQMTGGNVSLRNVTTDSDVVITENEGSVAVEESSIVGDARVTLNENVTIRGTSFALEDVNISWNRGRLVFDANCDLNLTVVGNPNVEITNNNPIDAAAAGAMCTSGLGLLNVDVSGNDSVRVINNTGETLTCTDNGYVESIDNAFTLTLGQCALEPAAVSEHGLVPFELSGMRPNPVQLNRTPAVFDFTLPFATSVRLDVLDLSGRVVREVLHEWRTGGFQSIAWDGRTDSGSDAPAGLYFYRLTAGNETLVKRLVVLR